jgi:dethiobiotin synthetase
MTNRQAWFLTGTDTEIGKTFIACALLHAARASGRSALGMKPVAAGAEDIDGVRINEDAARLLAAGSFDPGLQWLNPYCLSQPVAPHIAAATEGVSIDPSHILKAFRLLQTQADVVIVEGVGGFRVPLDDHYDTADLAVDLGLPVILVVGMRLGCINHALLTVEAIRARGLRLAGWIANCITADMPRLDENIAALQQRISAPLLGVVPYVPENDPSPAAQRLQLPD